MTRRSATVAFFTTTSVRTGIRAGSYGICTSRKA
jgi:hypothetical protein